MGLREPPEIEKAPESDDPSKPAEKPDGWTLAEPSESSRPCRT